MSRLESIRNELPEYARDIKLNLQTVLRNNALTPDQRWGVAVTSAATTGNGRLLDAVLEDARAEAAEPVIEDALAAAALMGMNNVYYRFRHLVGKDVYARKPARLRMNRLMKPLSSKVDFELFSLAASAINACEICIQSHEKVVVEGGVSEDAVHDAIRIAATIQATAMAMGLPAAATASPAA